MRILEDLVAFIIGKIKLKLKIMKGGKNAKIRKRPE